MKVLKKAKEKFFRVIYLKCYNYVKFNTWGGDMSKFLKFLLIFLLLFTIAYGKEYRIDEARVYYNILPSGEIDFNNQLKYDFLGSFSRAWITIPKGKYSIKDISVGEIIDGSLKKYTYHPETSERIPDTFDVVVNSKEYKISWFYRANYTQKTFVISYKLINALKVYNDVAEFYWKVWGEDWDLRLPALWVEVNLPSEIKSKNDVNYWLHPKIEGKIGIKKDYKGIIAYAGNISPHQWVEVRVVFPRSYLTDLDPFKVELVAKNGKDLILKEEEKWKKEEERKEFLQSIVTIIFGILSVILLLLGFILPLRIYFKYGREPKVQYEREYEQEPPSDIPPAWVEALVNQSSTLSPNSIVASTLELARRGYLKFQEEVKEGFLGRKHRDYKIIITDKEIENDLSKELKLLLDTLKGFGKEFYISELRKKDLSGFKTAFDKEVEKIVFQEKKWIIDEGKRKLIYLIVMWVVMDVFLAILITITHFWGIFPLIFIGVINTVISAIFMHSTQRYSPEGKLLALRWKAFKRYLQDFSLISERPPSSLVLWEKYLVYGTVLGVAKQVLKAMQMLNVPVDQITWYTPAYAGSIASLSESIQSFSSSLEAFSDSFSNSVVSSTTSPSSGGGGRGGGGGGGGAD